MNLVQPQQASWSAELSLQLKSINGQTKLVYQKHAGPLRVQRQFSQDDGSCHLYILHPPGGLVGGDSLSTRITAGADTQTLVTSPSAGKAYRCATNALPQTVSQLIDVDADAHLEWLPQETIYYDGAQAFVDNQVTLHERASFLGWEIQMLGRHAAGERFSTGSIEQSSRIWRAGMLVHRERFKVSAENREHKWGLAGAGVFGTLVAIARDDALLSSEQVIPRLRALLEVQYWGVTLKGCTVMVRYLGDSAETCRQGFEVVRQFLVECAVFNGSTSGHVPRIWKT